MENAANSGPPKDAADRLGAQVERMRWIAVHCAGRALLRRLDIDDLVQEALLRAWQDRAHWPSPEGGDLGFARWLAVLVRHAAIDAARASRARKRSGREERLEIRDFSHSGLAARELPAQTAGPATRAAGAEARANLERAFQRLSGEHRRVIALRQFEGRSAAEAGERLQKGESAVHSSLRRALQAWEREAARTFPTSGDESNRGLRSTPA